MKNILITFIFLIIATFQDNPVVIKLENVPEHFTVDNLGNIYVYFDNNLKKYSPQGLLMAQFSRLESGKLFSLDVSDPMQLLLFYKDFNQLVFLDNKLCPLGNVLYLDQLNSLAVSTVCKSKQFAVWFFDEYENKLIQYGYNPKGILQSINIDNYTKERLQFNYLLEYGNELYLNQEGKAVWVFDIFGSNLKKIDLQIKKEFQVSGKKIIYNNGLYIFKYNLLQEKTDSISNLNIGKFDNAKILSESIYLLSHDSIVITKL